MIIDQQRDSLSLNRDFRFLTALLRIALRGFFVAEDWPDDSCRWEEVLRMAREQTVAGVALEGVALLPEELMPPADVRLAWIAGARRTEMRNAAADKAAEAVAEWFGRHGLRGCLLKGQGNALASPWPRRREPGDVDIWLRPADGRGGAVRRVLQLARESGVGGKACYHHIQWHKWQGVGVEAHYRPSFLYNPFANARLQRWFDRNAERQFANRVVLPNGAGSVAVPTAEFNAVYQLCHLQQHFLNEGVGLRQVTDYYMTLRKLHSAGKCAPKSSYMPCAAFASALMWVLVESYAMPRDWAVAEPDARRGHFLLREIMLGGNFGGSGRKRDECGRQSALRHNAARLWRDVRLFRMLPSECLWEPFFRLWHYGWRLCAAPK